VSPATTTVLERPSARAIRVRKAAGKPPGIHASQASTPPASADGVVAVVGSTDGPGPPASTDEACPPGRNRTTRATVVTPIIATKERRRRMRAAWLVRVIGYEATTRRLLRRRSGGLSAGSLREGLFELPHIADARMRSRARDAADHHIDRPVAGPAAR
jgi:hypothetical protein